MHDPAEEQDSPALPVPPEPDAPAATLDAAAVSPVPDEPAPAIVQVPAAAGNDAAAETAPKLADLSPAACGAKLAELFPALFGPDGPPMPLKLKIQADIQQRAPHTFTRKSLGIFFSRYTTGNAYLKALLNAPHRFDLDGQPAGEIAAEHKAAATEELARRRAIADERRAAEREAHRAAEKAAFKERQQAEREAHKVHVVADQARRDRAFLLRAFETSSLTKANFCALKGVTETELDAQLELARQERAQRPPMPPRPEAPRHDQRPARDERPGRPDRGPRPGGPPRGAPRGPR
jgi:ProP effector